MSDVENRLQQAAALYYAGRTEEARALFLSVAEAGGGNSVAFMHLATMAISERNLQAALDFASRGIRIDGANIMLINLTGTILHNLGQTDKAITFYQEALRLLQPMLAAPAPAVRKAAGDIHANLSYALTDAGRYEEAVHAIGQAAAFSPAPLDIAPHVDRIRFVERRRADPAAAAAAAELDASVAAMNAELDRMPLYAASEYWGFFGTFSVELLRRYGIERFKRTVSHLYQNWLITTADDPQFVKMLETWPQHRSPQPLLNEIEAPTHVGYHSSYDFQKQDYALAYPEQREVYKLAVGLIWETVLAGDRFGILKTLEESEVGDPVRIRRQGKLISSDLAHSVRERNMLLEAGAFDGREGLCVAELGAGYGRLAEVFGRTTNYRYIIFDIAPALHVSQWYIRQIFPNEKIFTFRPFQSFAEIADELAECRFAFFTANQIEYFPDGYFDLFVNLNSLMEMRKEQIVNYIRQIDRLTRRAFLSRQWITWRNRFDRHTVERNDYAMSPNWEKTLDVVDAIHPQFFNHIWTKRAG